LLKPRKATDFMADTELDVRQLRKPDKHPTIFATYAALAVGESFVLVNNHDPKHLHEEFEADHAGSYRWEYIEKGPAVWRIRITKLTSTPLPRILVNTAEVTAIEPDVRGVVWKLEAHDRGLDSNIVALPPGGGIDTHAGAEVDVLIHVLSGSGRLTTERGTIDLVPGVLLWLPRRSRRQFSAGPDGLRYLTVHQKREILPLTPTVRQAV
jgi:uncharacterized protein (DUF2249 family)/quercetin dioxygenase-like cupin family protein